MGFPPPDGRVASKNFSLSYCREPVNCREPDRARVTRPLALVRHARGRLPSGNRPAIRNPSIPLRREVPMLTDRFGLAVSTGSSAARDAYIEGVDLLLTVYPGAIAAFDR